MINYGWRVVESSSCRVGNFVLSPTRHYCYDGDHCVGCWQSHQPYLCHKFYTCGQLWCIVGGILYIRKLYADYMQWTALILEQVAQRKLEFKCIMVKKMGNAEKMRRRMAKTVAYLGNLLVLEIHLTTLMNDLMNALNQMHKTHQV